MKKTIINFASILWSSIGALVSLMLIYPLVISLIKYDSKNPQEIHQSAKYLMQLIKDNDPLHYERMKN